MLQDVKIHREELPPPIVSNSYCVYYNSLNNNELRTTPSGARRRRFGGVFLFVFVAMVTLLAVSCTKDEGDNSGDSAVMQYHEQEWNWNF